MRQTRNFRVIQRSIIKTSAMCCARKSMQGPYYILIAVHVSYGIAIVILNGSYLAPRVKHPRSSC